jgi:hypothetical protein
MGIINNINYIKMKQIKKTAGKTAPSNKLDLAYKYLDARSEEESLPKAPGIFILEGCSDDDEDYDDFTFRKAFFLVKDNNGNNCLLPRQLDYHYDVKQFINVMSVEQTDYLVNWFTAQKQMDAAFTYYIDDLDAFLRYIINREFDITKKYDGYNKYRLVSITTDNIL